ESRKLKLFYRSFMTRRRIHGVLAFIALASTVYAQAPSPDRTRILQAIQAIPGFGAASESSHFDASNVERFDNRLAPDLKLYGLRGITIQRWATTPGTVKVTLFEMLDAPAAYGVYTLQRSKLGGTSTPVLIGAASFQTPGELQFWQSNYAIRIEAPEDLQNTVAREISRSILGKSEKPPVSSYLP